MHRALRSSDIGPPLHSICSRWAPGAVCGPTAEAAAAHNRVTGKCKKSKLIHELCKTSAALSLSFSLSPFLCPSVSVSVSGPSVFFSLSFSLSPFPVSPSRSLSLLFERLNVTAGLIFVHWFRAQALSYTELRDALGVTNLRELEVRLVAGRRVQLSI